MQDKAPSFKKPNKRHFYAYQYRSNIESGLSLDCIRFQNTVIVPGIDVDKDVKVIESGTAKYKELLYLPVHWLPSLNWRIIIVLSIILSLMNHLPGSKTSLDISGSLFIFLLACSFYVFVATWIIRYFYQFIGVNRVKVHNAIFNIVFFITGGTTLYAYITHSGSAALNLFWQLSNLVIALYLAPALVTFFSCINIRANNRIKIEHEWQVDGRSYGGHLNQNNEIVLYPKAGEGFYPLDALEYKALLAYQTTQGNQIKAKELIRVWRTQPLAEKIDDKLMRIKQFNLPKQLGLLLFKASAPSIGLLLENVAEKFDVKVLVKSGNWLKRQGFNRVFFIYQDCESALTHLSQIRHLPKKI
jgi:hypothetical protein